MAFGLQTYDSTGGVLISTSDRLTRYISSTYVSIGARGSTFVSVPGMTGDGTWIVIGVQNFLGITYGTDGYTVTNASTSSTVSANLYTFRV